MAENCNSSDSSDDDYPPRSKSRYPNRIRPRHGDRGSKYEQRREPSRKSGERKDSGSTLQQGDVDSDLSSSLNSQEEVQWHAQKDWRAHHHERLQPRGMADSNKHFSHPTMQSSSIRKVLSASAVVKKVPPLTNSGSHVSRYQGHKDKNSLKQKTRALSHIQTASHRNPAQVEEEGEDEEVMPQICETVRAVVGYIGSIETPSSHTRPHQRLQVIIDELLLDWSKII